MNIISGYRFLKARESGLTNILLGRLWEILHLQLSSEEDTFKAVDISQIKHLFWFLLFGVLIGFVLFVCELVIYFFVNLKKKYFLQDVLQLFLHQLYKKLTCRLEKEPTIN